MEYIKFIERLEGQELQIYNKAICLFFDISKSELLSQKETLMLTRKEQRRIQKFVKWIYKGKDITMLVGYKHFYNVKIIFSKKVFIPQYDSEGLVDQVLRTEISGRGLEVGTGSGAIALAIQKSKPEIKMLGIDVSSKAIDSAKENASINKIDTDFHTKDIFEWEPAAKFDFIVSNPPYITKGDSNVTGWVRKNQPSVGLYTNDDGLKFYKYLIINKDKYIKEGGSLYFECGFNTWEKLTPFLVSISADYRFENDLSGFKRYLIVK